MLARAAYGWRRFIPITGGLVTGPWLAGRVLAGGGDWQTIRPDDVVDLQAHYVCELADGRLVEIDNGLSSCLAQGVGAYRARGDGAALAYCFHTCARLKTTSRRRDRLDRALFIANAEREADRVVIELFAMGCREADMRPQE